MVLISGTGIAGPIHEALAFHIVFPQAVNDNMHMDVAAFIMPVHVCADQGLVAGEIFPGILHPKFLRPFPGQSIFICVLRVEADNVMMGFDFIIRFIFTVQGVQFPALHIEGEWVAVYTVHDISFARNQFSVFIEYRLVGIFIMFKHEITLYLCIVGIFTRYVFQDCHENVLRKPPGNPRPSLTLHTSFRRFWLRFGRLL